MAASFPIFLKDSTDPILFCFASLEEAADYLEPIDVENREYEAWDAQGHVLRLHVRPGQTPWLGVASTGERDFAALVFAVREHARTVGFELEDPLTEVTCDLVTRMSTAWEQRRTSRKPVGQ